MLQLSTIVTISPQHATPKMKDLVIVPLNKKQVLRAAEYCEEYSVPLPPMLKEQLRVTEELSKEESIMAISASQCAWLMSFAQVLRPARGQYGILQFYQRRCASRLIFPPQ
jgi:hypothetical protein